MTKKAKDLPCCDAVYDYHYTTYTGIVGSPRMYRDKDCSRKGRVAMHNTKRPGKTFHFCRTHARMAREGFLSEDGKTMDPASRADYQRGRMGREKTRFHGIWHEGEAPPAPALDESQLRLLGRSVNAERKAGFGGAWMGRHVPVTGKTIKVAQALQQLGLGYFRENERDNKPGMFYSFCANEPGSWMFKQTEKPEENSAA